jgi:hypothetical protein
MRRLPVKLKGIRPAGERIVAQGTAEEAARTMKPFTGQGLATLLNGAANETKPPLAKAAGSRREVPISC